MSVREYPRGIGYWPCKWNVPSSNLKKKIQTHFSPCSDHIGNNCTFVFNFQEQLAYSLSHKIVETYRNQHAPKFSKRKMAALTSLISGCDTFWKQAGTTAKRHEYSVEWICALYECLINQSINQSVNQSIPVSIPMQSLRVQFPTFNVLSPISYHGYSVRRHKFTVYLNSETGNRLWNLFFVTFPVWEGAKKKLRWDIRFLSVDLLHYSPIHPEILWPIVGGPAMTVYGSLDPIKKKS
jgi:hypothetical protein